MHHLSRLGVDKDYKNENIYFYMAECGENITKSYHVSAFICYVINPISLFRSQMIEFTHFYELCEFKDLGKV